MPAQSTEPPFAGCKCTHCAEGACRLRIKSPAAAAARNEQLASALTSVDRHEADALPMVEAYQRLLAPPTGSQVALQHAIEDGLEESLVPPPDLGMIYSLHRIEPHGDGYGPWDVGEAVMKATSIEPLQQHAKTQGWDDHSWLVQVRPIDTPTLPPTSKTDDRFILARGAWAPDRNEFTRNAQQYLDSSDEPADLIEMAESLELEDNPYDGDWRIFDKHTGHSIAARPDVNGPLPLPAGFPMPRPVALSSRQKSLAWAHRLTEAKALPPLNELADCETQVDLAELFARYDAFDPLMPIDVARGSWRNIAIALGTVIVIGALAAAFFK